MNKHILLGRLGADPEVKYTSRNKAVCTLRVASNEVYRDSEGKVQRKVEWHRIVCWGTTAENCAKYLSKGRQVIVEGRVQTRSWDDKDGTKRYTTETVANTVTFVDGQKTTGDTIQPAASSAGMVPPPIDADEPEQLGIGEGDVPL